MTVLGYWVLVVALCSTGASALLYYRATTNGPAALVLPRRLLTLAVLSLAPASVLLLTLLLRHDFTNGYVFSYSDRSLPLHYLISTFYAGKEGSFIFWALCAAVIALVLRRSAGRRGLEPWVMTAYMAVLAMSVLLI